MSRFDRHKSCLRLASKLRWMREGVAVVEESNFHFLRFRYFRYFHLKLRLRMPWPGQGLAASQLSAKRSWRAVCLRIASSSPLLRRSSSNTDGEKLGG